MPYGPQKRALAQTYLRLQFVFLSPTVGAGVGATMKAVLVSLTDVSTNELERWMRSMVVATYDGERERNKQRSN